MSRLPTELLELIIEKISDSWTSRPTLKACSLVSSQMKPSSQRGLFFSFRYGDNLPSFTAVLARNPALADHVVSFDAFFCIEDPQLPNLLAGLSKVRTFTLGAPHDQWESITPYLIAALQTHTFLAITYLELKYMNGVQFPSLRAPTCST